MISTAALWSNWEQKGLGKHWLAKCSCIFIVLINTVKIKTIIQLSPEVLLVQYHQNKFLSWGLNMILAQDIRAGSEYLELSWELRWES